MSRPSRRTHQLSASAQQGGRRDPRLALPRLPLYAGSRRARGVATDHATPAGSVLCSSVLGNSAKAVWCVAGAQRGGGRGVGACGARGRGKWWAGWGGGGGGGGGGG